MSYEELRDRRRRLVADAIRREMWARLDHPTGQPTFVCPLDVSETQAIEMFSQTLEKMDGTSRATIYPKTAGATRWAPYVTDAVASVEKRTGVVVGEVKASLLVGPGIKSMVVDNQPFVLMGAHIDMLFTDEEEMSVIRARDHPFIFTRALSPMLVCIQHPTRRITFTSEGGRTILYTFTPPATTATRPSPQQPGPSRGDG
jgi:hypothetical protein